MIEPGRPVVLRRGTVLTMNDAHEILRDADVLVEGEQIAAVGPGLEVPEGTFEIDASGGIVMPGMVDTHVHLMDPGDTAREDFPTGTRAARPWA